MKTVLCFRSLLNIRVPLTTPCWMTDWWTVCPCGLSFTTASGTRYLLFTNLRSSSTKVTHSLIIFAILQVRWSVRRVPSHSSGRPLYSGYAQHAERALSGRTSGDCGVLEDFNLFCNFIGLPGCSINSMSLSGLDTAHWGVGREPLQCRGPSFALLPGTLGTTTTNWPPTITIVYNYY